MSTSSVVNSLPSMITCCVRHDRKLAIQLSVLPLIPKNSSFCRSPLRDILSCALEINLSPGFTPGELKDSNDDLCTYQNLRTRKHSVFV